SQPLGAQQRKRNDPEQEHEEQERGARLAPAFPDLGYTEDQRAQNRKRSLQNKEQRIKVDGHSASQVRRIAEIEAPHHQVTVMRHRAFAGVVQHVLERAGQEDHRVEDDQQQCTGAQQKESVSLASRRVDLFVAAEVVVEKIQAQVMRKVFGGQHQAETGAAGEVVLFGPLGVRGGDPFGTPVEVVAQPGEKHQQRVLFGLTVNHNGDGSDRPKQSAEQSDLGSEEFLGHQENDDSHQGTEDNVGQADGDFFRDLMGVSQSPVPGVGR